MDLPAFGQAGRLIWHKRWWRCGQRECDVGTVIEQDPEIASAREADHRAGLWATHQAGSPWLSAEHRPRRCSGAAAVCM